MNQQYFSLVVTIVLCIGIARVYADDDEGTCQCGVFKDNEAHGESCIPIISKTPGFTVSCDEEGLSNCMQMCTALAQAAKESAPSMLCEVVKDLDQGFKPSVFSKACDVADWTYTGLTASEAICCEGGVHTPCDLVQ